MLKVSSVRARYRISGLALVVIAALLVFFGLAVSFWLSASSRPVLKADPDNTRQVALGQAIYVRRCASCHGKHLEGQPNWQVRKTDGRLPAPPHDETGHT